jgi:acetate kinase
MPVAATTYALPNEYRERGVRRYGFHGLSCESIVYQLRDAEARKELVFPRRLIIAHLGNGCSLTAVEDGRSVDNTMGLTPTGGVVMGTRSGDLDPGLILYLLRQLAGDGKARADALEKMLNRESGLLTLSGLSSDMRVVHDAAGKGNAAAELALQIFARGIKKAIGSYLCLLGRVDAMIFAGGIGEHDSRSREAILAGCEGVGFVIDKSLNEKKTSGLRKISAANSATGIFVVPTQEDLMIARHVDRLERQSS